MLFVFLVHGTNIWSTVRRQNFNQYGLTVLKKLYNIVLKETCMFYLISTGTEDGLKTIALKIKKTQIMQNKKLSGNKSPLTCVILMNICFLPAPTSQMLRMPHKWLY